MFTHTHTHTYIYIYTYTYKAKFSRYRTGLAQRVGRSKALLFRDRGTRRGWVVSTTPPPHFTPGKDPVPILQEAGWAPGPIWTGGKSCPHRDSIPNRPASSQSLYRLSYPAHNNNNNTIILRFLTERELKESLHNWSRTNREFPLPIFRHHNRTSNSIK